MELPALLWGGLTSDNWSIEKGHCDLVYIYIYVTLKDEFFSELSNFVTLNGGGEPSWLGR